MSTRANTETDHRDWANEKTAELCRVTRNIVAIRVSNGKEETFLEGKYVVRAENNLIRYNNSQNVTPEWFVISEADSSAIHGTGEAAHRSQDYFHTN
jgi:hypothetical protein